MELIVRAVDVGSGNAKFVTGISGADIRCASFPSVAYPSSADTSAMPAAEKRKTVCIPVGSLFYEVGPDIHLAADTFRAAAIDQLATWAGRARAELVKQREGADPSAVVFDALRSARQRGIDTVLVDTAGRLHTKSNLMAELGKMARVAGREVPGAPHEVLLVVDATTGQNGLSQAQEFTRAAGITGVVLTKLDGTAKGGVALGIHRQLGVPIRYVGVGEGLDDLLDFDPDAYVEGLVGAAETA